MRPIVLLSEVFLEAEPYRNEKRLGCGAGIFGAGVIIARSHALQVAAPIYKSTQSARQAIWMTTASGLFEPLGALMAGWFLRPYVTDYILNALYCGGTLC